jgi:hypothetical protein
LYSCDIHFCIGMDEDTYLPTGNVLFFVNTYDMLTDIYIYIYIYIYMDIHFGILVMCTCVMCFLLMFFFF